MAHVKNMEAAKTMEDVDITATNTVTAVEEDVVQKTTVIGMEDMVVEPTVMCKINVGSTTTASA